MLPFDQRPWASTAAKAIIVFTLLAEVGAVLWLQHDHPLDIPEIVALALILIGVIPTNVYIIRRKPGDPAPPDLSARLLPLSKHTNIR